MQADSREKPLDITPAYLRKADSFNTNQKNLIHHTLANMAIVPVFFGAIVVIIHQILFGTRIIGVWGKYLQLRDNYLLSSTSSAATILQILNYVLAGVILIVSVSILFFDIAAPAHWRIKARPRMATTIFCLGIIFTIDFWQIWLPKDIWSLFKATVLGFFIVWLGYWGFVWGIRCKYPFFRHILHIFCFVVPVALVGLFPTSIIKIPSSVVGGGIIGSFFIANKLFGLRFSANPTRGSFWENSIIDIVETFILALIAFVVGFISLSIGVSKQNPVILALTVLFSILITAFPRPFLSEQYASFFNMNRRGRRDWLYSRSSQFVSPQRWPNYLWEYSIPRYLSSQNRTLITLTVIGLGGIIVPIFIYWLSNQNDPDPQSSELTSITDVIQWIVQKQTDTWEITPIELLAIGLISTVVFVGILTLWYATTRRDRYVVAEFNIVREHENKDPKNDKSSKPDETLRVIAETMRRSLIKELQGAALTLKRRHIENVSFTNEDANAFFISSGFDHEFLQQLEEIGTFDLPQIGGLSLGRLWSLYLKSIARMFATGHINHDENGDIGIHISLKYRHRRPVYVSATLELASDGSGIDEYHIQHIARELALKVIIELGQVPGVGQSWRTLDNFLRGIEAANHQNWWKAISYYYDAINLRSHNVQEDKHGLIYFHLGAALLFQGRWELGGQMLRKADEYGPAIPEISYMLAFLLTYTFWGILEEAEMVFEQIERYCKKTLELDPNSPEAYHLWGIAAYRRGRNRDREGSKKPASTPSTPLNQFSQRDIQSDYAKATRLYRKAIQLYDRKIKQIRRQKNYDERTLRNLIQQRMTVGHKLGDSLRSRNLFAEAEQYYVDMEVLYPQNTRNIADTLKTYAMGRTWERAQAYFYRVAFNSLTARWDADVLIHAAWLLKSGIVDSRDKPPEEQYILHAEAFAYLDYALYMRPRYIESWRQTAWRAAFEANASVTPSDEIGLQEIFQDFSFRVFDFDKKDFQSNSIWLDFLRWEREKQIAQHKPKDKTKDKTKDQSPDLFILPVRFTSGNENETKDKSPDLFLRFLEKTAGALPSSKTRLLRETMRIDSLATAEEALKAIIDSIIETERRSLIDERETGLRRVFEHLHYALKLYEDCYNPLSLWISSIDKTLDKTKPYPLWLTKLGRLGFDLYLRITLLTARMLAQAGLYTILAELSATVVDEISVFIQQWQGRYHFDSQPQIDVGKTNHFTLTPYVYRYQWVSMLAWNAYSSIMQYQDFLAKCERGDQAGVNHQNQALAQAKRHIEQAIRLIPVHPLLMFVNAKVMALEGRYMEAIQELKSLLDVIEPFDPKRDVGGSVIDSLQPEPTTNKDRNNLYYLERVTGRQQFHNIVNPVTIYTQIARYAMILGDQSLSVSYLSEAIRVSPFSDTHMDIFITLANQFTTMERYADAQAVITATLTPRSHLQTVALSPTKRSMPEVLEAVVMTRRNFHAKALRYTQKIAKNFRLVQEDEIVAQVTYLQELSHNIPSQPTSDNSMDYKDFSQDFKTITESFKTNTQNHDSSLTDYTIDKLKVIIGNTLLDGSENTLGDMIHNALTDIFKTPNSNQEMFFPRVFECFNPKTLKEQLNRLAGLARYSLSQTAMQQLINQYEIQTSASDLNQVTYERVRFANIALFHATQARDNLIQIAEICNVLAYNRASTTISDAKFALMDARVAIIIISYLRGIADTNHELYGELGQKLAQYCDTLGWVQFNKVMPSAIYQELIRTRKNIFDSNGENIPEQEDLIKNSYFTQEEGIALAIGCFEIGIHYDPTRSIIHYHLAFAYLQTAEIMLQDEPHDIKKLSMIIGHLDAAERELDIARLNDPHNRLHERIKQLILWYKRLKKLLKM